MNGLPGKLTAPSEGHCWQCLAEILPDAFKGCMYGHVFCEVCVRRNWQVEEDLPEPPPVVVSPPCEVDIEVLLTIAEAQTPEGANVRCCIQTHLSDEEGVPSCDWTGAVERMRAHLSNDCPLAMIACPNCCHDDARDAPMRIQRGVLDDHISNNCELVYVDCPNDGCVLRSLRGQIGEHRDICPHEIVDCPNGCHGEGDLVHRMARQEVDRHRQSCQYQRLPCPFVVVGCSLPLRRCDLRSHQDQAVDQHRRLLETCNSGFVGAMKRITQLEKNESNMLREFNKLQSRMMDQEARLTSRLDDLETQLGRVHADPTAGQRRSVDLSSLFKSSSSIALKERRVSEMLENQSDRHWEHIERLCLELKEQAHELDRLRSIVMTKLSTPNVSGTLVSTIKPNSLKLSWWLTADHLLRSTGLASSDFSLWGVGFEMGITAPDAAQWRGFLLRVTNRSGSGVMPLVLSYTLSAQLPDGRHLQDDLTCPEHTYTKNAGNDNWGFRQFLRQDSDAIKGITRHGGLNLELTFRKRP